MATAITPTTKRRMSPRMARGWTPRLPRGSRSNANVTGKKRLAPKRRDRSVMRQVESLAPASLLGGAGDVLEDLEFLELLPVLGVVSRARPGYIQPDIVPRDKLERYQGP